MEHWMRWLSIKKRCVDLRSLPAELYEELVSEDYTVVRSGGWEQGGWRIPTKPHESCYSSTGPSKEEGSLACNCIKPDGTIGPQGSGPWRIYMVFDGEASTDPEKEHICGWRPCSVERRNFWPTRLGVEAREAWWLRLVDHLDTLKSQEGIIEEEKEPCRFCGEAPYICGGDHVEEMREMQRDALREQY